MLPSIKHNLFDIYIRLRVQHTGERLSSQMHEKSFILALCQFLMSAFYNLPIDFKKFNLTFR